MRFVLFLCCFSLLANPCFASDQIGTVVGLEGSAKITPEDGQAFAAVVDSPVSLNDVIETGPDTKAVIQFIDGTEIILSADTKLVADEFVYDPENISGNKADYSILRGTFLYTSGLIAKRPQPDVKVNTPYGAVGIRGTQFWGGPIDGAYGVLVNEGAVTIRNARGIANLNKGNGAMLSSLLAAPRDIKPWTKEKISRAVATITLRQPEIVKERIARRSEANKRLVQERRERLKQLKLKRQNEKSGAPRRQLRSRE